jgi:hypothetical protein
MMVDLLRSLPRRENNPLFFTNTQGGPAKSWSDANKKVLPAIAKLDCGDAFPPLDPENPKTTGPWIRHDLRRTLATNMQDMGIDTHMIDAIEGRLIQGTGRVYMRSDMIDEKRKALVKWEDRLRNILNPPPLDNIVPLNAAARN